MKRTVKDLLDSFLFKNCIGDVREGQGSSVSVITQHTVHKYVDSQKRFLASLVEGGNVTKYIYCNKYILGLCWWYCAFLDHTLMG